MRFWAVGEAATESACLTLSISHVPVQSDCGKEGILSNTVLHCATVLGETKTTSAPVCSCKLESRGSLVSLNPLLG